MPKAACALGGYALYSNWVEYPECCLSDSNTSQKHSRTPTCVPRNNQQAALIFLPKTYFYSSVLTGWPRPVVAVPQGGTRQTPIEAGSAQLAVRSRYSLNCHPLEACPRVSSGRGDPLLASLVLFRRLATATARRCWTPDQVRGDDVGANPVRGRCLHLPEL